MPDEIINPEPREAARNIQAKMELASQMSRSLLYISGRNYLEQADVTDLFSIPPASSPQIPPRFIKIAQLGRSDSQDPFEALVTLQTALAAVHGDHNQQLIFLVIHDGKQNHIYLGVRNLTKPAVAFLKSFERFFGGLFVGADLQVINPGTAEYARQISAPLEEMTEAICLTGIPSVKQSGQKDYLSCLDRLLTGAQGKPFAYLVIASPVKPEAVDDVIARCRDLVGQVHTLSRINLSMVKTQSETNQQSIANSSGKQATHGETESETYLGAGGVLSNTLNSAATLTGVASLVFPPAAFLSGLFSSGAAAASMMLPQSTQSSSSNSVTFSENLTETLSSGTTTGESAQLGTEYINAHVVAAEQMLNQVADRFYQRRSQGLWNVGVYCLSDSPDVVNLAGAQLCAVLNGSASLLEPVRSHNIEAFMRNNDYLNRVLRLEKPVLRYRLNPRHPFGELFDDLTTPLTTAELSLLINSPRREIPGIKLVATADFSLNHPVNTGRPSIHLGYMLDGGRKTNLDYDIETADLARHALVTGITGSGKTNTCFQILAEMLRQKVPFLIIEPAKDEYVTWAMRRNQGLGSDDPGRIGVYMPGAKTWRGQALENLLNINPLDVIWLDSQDQPDILAHIDRLKSVLAAAFPMQEVLPVLLEDLLFDVYEKNHWLGKTLDRGMARPTITMLFDRAQDIVRAKGYETTVQANLTAALKTRIDSLRRGWKGELFNQSSFAADQRSKATPFSCLFDRPAVVNLSHLGDDADKAFAMAVLFQFLYEYRQAQFEADPRPRGLAHLTILEEAHRVLLAPSAAVPEAANPQAKMAGMFANILSEMRLYGQGMLVVDQVPSRLIPDAIKNTNLKIVHRLVSADERAAMAGSMTLSEPQAAIINRLSKGQAVVFGDQDDAASWIQVPYVKGEE